MKEYLKMADCFNVGMPDVKTRLFYAEHAINSHDELVAEVERLTKLVEAMSLDAPQKPIFKKQ